MSNRLDLSSGIPWAEKWPAMGIAEVLQSGPTGRKA
jgi:hypothetical protein